MTQVTSPYLGGIMEYRQAISIAIDTLDCLASSVAGNENKGVTGFAEVAKTLGDSVRRISPRILHDERDMECLNRSGT